jgi:hypothetical protein
MIFFYLQAFILSYSFIVILSDHIFVLYFIKTQPFVKRKPVKTEKNTWTIALRFKQVLLYYIYVKFIICKPFHKICVRSLFYVKRSTPTLLATSRHTVRSKNLPHIRKIAFYKIFYSQSFNINLNFCWQQHILCP